MEKPHGPSTSGIDTLIRHAQECIEQCHADMKAIKEEERKQVSVLDRLYFEKAVMLLPVPPFTLVEVEWKDMHGTLRKCSSFLDNPQPSGFGKPYRLAFRGVAPDGAMSSRPEWRFRPDQVVCVREITGNGNPGRTFRPKAAGNPVLDL